MQQKQPFHLKNIENEQHLKTLGGEYVTFRNERKKVLESFEISNGKFFT
jgi:hypothetical protein